MDKGVDVDTGKESGNTPLLNAVRGGHLEIVELLIARGADPDAGKYRDRGAAGKGKGLKTAIFATDKIEVMKLLIAAGADLDYKVAPPGWTVLHYKATYSDSESNLDIIQLLIKNGAKVKQIASMKHAS